MPYIMMLSDPDEDETNNISTSNKSLNTLSLIFHKLMNLKFEETKFWGNVNEKLGRRSQSSGTTLIGT